MQLLEEAKGRFVGRRVGRLAVNAAGFGIVAETPLDPVGFGEEEKLGQEFHARLTGGKA
jgi:hypothetical protein